MVANKGPQLTSRDLQLIGKVAVYKFLTTFQIQRLYFPDGNYRIATNRLTTLTKGGFLSRIFSYPKGKGEQRGHPTAVYYWAPSNQKCLKAYLEERGQASLWEEYENLAKTYNKNKEFSQLFLVHELGISEFFLCLEKACQAKGLELAFWERTSPFSKDLGERLVTDLLIETPQGKATEKTTVHFNPDAFFCLKGEDEKGTYHNFFFLEYDNNTASAEKYRRKLAGYLAYYQHNRFPNLLARYTRKYLLPISNIEKAGFRVLTITPDEHRRNTLFIEALKLRSYIMLWFASLSNITSETVLSPLWLRGKEFVSIAEEFKTLAPETTPAVKSRWLDEKLAHMQRVSLKD